MPFMSLTPPIQGTDLQRIYNGFTTDLLSGRQPLSFAFSLLPFDRFTMQSYNISIAVHECFANFLIFFPDQIGAFCCSVDFVETAGARHS